MNSLKLFVGLFVAIAVLSNQQAVAAQPNVCEAYADQATRQLVKDAVKICGYSGPAWQATREQHKRWCLGASHDDVMSEQAKRNEWTDRCTSCYRYAKDAIRAQKKNDNLKCGFTGDPWSWDEQGHFNWCVNNDLAAKNLGEKIRPFTETGARDRALKQCEAKAKDCNTYAQQASAGARDNFLFGCKLPGARFGTGDHYGWCMANDPSVAAKEQKARSDAIAICRKEFTETEIQGCKNYATTAVNQWKRAQILASGCKLDGGRWHANWDAHFAWCIGNFRGFEGTRHGALLMTSENAARDAEMKGCVGRSVNRHQRFPTKPSSQGKTLSSKNDASSKSSKQRGVLEGGGLLDTNHGFVRQGPSPTGTPGGGAGGSAPPSRGGGASTLR